MTYYLPGDILSRRKGLVQHKGIALDDGRVLHNVPGRGEHVSSLREFSAGRRVRAQRLSVAQRQRALRAARSHAYAQDDGRGYHLLRNNCEHTVNRLSMGEARSPQLRGWIAGLGIAGAALVLTRHPGLAAAGFALGRSLVKR